MRQTPNLESLHNLPDVRWGGYNGQGSVPLPSLPDLTDFIKLLLEKFLGQVVMAVVGSFFPGLPAFDQLKDWAQNIPGLSQFLDMLNTVFGPLFGGVDFSNPLDPSAVWRNVFETFIQPLIDFVQNILDPVTGLIPSWLLPPTNIGRLTGDLPTLVPDGSFDAVPQGDPAGRWFRDATVGRTNPGALAIVGTGAADDIVPQPVGVAPGQKYRPSAWVSWTGGSGSAGSLQLTVIEFQAGVAINTVVIGSKTPSGTSGWVEIAADYTVPSGVDQAAVVPAVTAGFTGGTAYFDDVTGPSTGNIQIPWVQDLAGSLNGILRMFGLGALADLIGITDPSSVWTQIISAILWPLNMLGKVVDGKLIDLQAPQIVQDTIDGVWNGFANLGQYLDTGLVRSVVPDSIAGLLGMNLNNSSAIASAEAAIRALQSAGNTLTDDFARGSASTLGANYNTLTSTGGGAGSVGTDGNGNAAWKPSGSGNRTMIYRYTPAQITTDSGVLRCMLSSTPPVTSPDDAYTYVCGWVHSTAETYVRLRIGPSTVTLQAVVAGTVYTLKTWSVSLKSGDTVELQRGQTGNTQLHRYILRVNNAQIDNFTDATSRAVSGSGVRGMGVGMETSLRVTILSPFFTQWQPAGLAIVTLSEVL